MSPKGKKENDAPRVLNRKARFDYHILETMEVGIVLRGTEVKAIRQGKCSIAEAFAYVEPATNELWLCQMDIGAYSHAAPDRQHQPKEKRKLLARRSQIEQLYGRTTSKGVTLVPLTLYFNDRGIAKIELGIGTGKTKGDKRQTLRKEEAGRSIRQAMSRRKIG